MQAGAVNPISCHGSKWNIIITLTDTSIEGKHLWAVFGWNKRDGVLVVDHSIE